MMTTLDLAILLSEYEEEQAWLGNEVSVEWTPHIREFCIHRCPGKYLECRNVDIIHANLYMQEIGDTLLAEIYTLNAGRSAYYLHREFIQSDEDSVIKFLARIESFAKEVQR